MREVLNDSKDILVEIEQMQNQLAAHDHSILAVIEFIKQIEVEKQLLTD